MYLVTRVTEMKEQYEESTLLTALEAALPAEVIKVALPEGKSDLNEICLNLKEDLNAPLLLYDEAEKINQWGVINEDIQKGIMSFLRRVIGFNNRCKVAGGEILELHWTFHQMVVC